MTLPGDAMTDVPVPATVLQILRTLEGAGHETWCVGGAIRDALLGGTPRDVDLATAATPQQVRALFRRTIPIGIEHGTVGVLDADGGLHEVTTFRRDVTTDGRHAVVAFGASLDEDLARRDFTINAIAWHPDRREWRDPFGGRDDLRAGILRAVGSAADRFREDRLRIIRALRFAARFGFAIDPATWDAMLAQGRDTRHLSAERVRDEWVKSVGTARDLGTLRDLWLRSGAAEAWLPELDPARPLDRLGPPGDRPDDPVILTALMAAPVGPLWRRLKGSTVEIRRSEAIDRGPAVPQDASGREVRRWMAATGVAADDLAQIARWRETPARDGSAAPLWLAEMRGVLERGEATARSGLALTGNDLVAEGIVTPGPVMGTLLDRLLEMVLDDPSLNRRDALLARARDLA